MRIALGCAMITTVVFYSTAVVAETTDVFEVKQLTDRLYLLVTDEGSYTTNVLASVGDDGVLLVDTNAKDNDKDFKAVIDAFGKGLPKYIINTHRHVEHVGGNAIFGGEPIGIAHTLLPKKLRSGSYLFDEFPEETMPDILFSDSLTLSFNGEQIRLIALGGSHDDNEIIVHFTESNVVHLSSLINGMNFPSVDGDGDALLFDSIVTRAIELLPEDVTIVSGHNGLASWGDLHEYRDMIRETTSRVRAGLNDGKDVATLQEEMVLSDYERFNQSYVSPERWIQYLADAIEHETDSSEPLLTIYEPIYYALKDGGTPKAVETFLALKTDSLHRYRVEEMDLLVIGDKLVHKDDPSPAIDVLELFTREYPKSDYLYFVHYDMSVAYQNLGDKESAIAHCSKALEYKPDYARAVQLLEELEKM